MIIQEGHLRHWRVTGSVLVMVVTSAALASQNHITGFEFNSCSNTICLSVHAKEAWISQINLGFTTGGATTVRMSNVRGRILNTYTATETAYYPDLDLLSVDNETTGQSLIISFKDGTARSFNAPLAGTNASKISTKTIARNTGDVTGIANGIVNGVAK